MKPNIPKAEDVDKEVHTWSGDISDGVVQDLLKAVLKRVASVDRTYDIPYVAGYSQDGGTVYIDRHMPKSCLLEGRRVQTDHFLILHETIEKALLDQLGLHYLHAHQIALRMEQAAVRAAGLTWRDYDRFTKANEKKIGDERLTRVPPDLDLTPYRDEDDTATLRNAMAAESA